MKLLKHTSKKTTKKLLRYSKQTLGALKRLKTRIHTTMHVAMYECMKGRRSEACVSIRTIMGLESKKTRRKEHTTAFSRHTSLFTWIYYDVNVKDRRQSLLCFAFSLMYVQSRKVIFQHTNIIGISYVNFYS